MSEITSYQGRAILLASASNVQPRHIKLDVTIASTGQLACVAMQQSRNLVDMTGGG